MSADAMHALRRLSAASCALLILLTGCVSSDYMTVGKKTFPPRPNDWVIDVYVGVDAPVVVHKSIANPRSTDEIPQGAEVIGRVDTNGAELASWASVIDDAKAKARQIGGDGLVIGQWGHVMTGVDAYGGSHYAKSLSFTVIRFKDQ